MALLGASAQGFGLWQDARDLTRIGASLAERTSALDGNILRAVGGVVEHLGFRARVHAGLTVLMLATATVLIVGQKRSAKFA